MNIHYMASEEEVLKQVECMRNGIVIYPEAPQYAKHWPKVCLVATINGKKHTLVKKPFDQKYLGYMIHRWYGKFYDLNFKKE